MEHTHKDELYKDDDISPNVPFFNDLSKICAIGVADPNLFKYMQLMSLSMNHPMFHSEKDVVDIRKYIECN
jgi:hypothetical protein